VRTEERITLQDAADALGISEQTARRWVKAGKLKAYKPGLRYLVPASAIEELLEEQSPKAPSSSPKAPELQVGEERRDSEVPSDEELEELGHDLFDLWEDELEQKLALAHSNPAAFFVWLQDVRNVGGRYVSRLVARYAATADGKLEAIIGMAPLMGRWRDLWHRIEEATESDPALCLSEEDEQRFREIIEEVSAPR
jgi:excisionase family DNA binding protein